VIDDIVFSDVPDNAILCKQMALSQFAQATAPLKELRRRDCARRHSRSYRGQVLQRQRLPGFPGTRRPAGKGG